MAKSRVRDPKPGGAAPLRRDSLAIGVVAVGIWLGWQIIRALLVTTAPPAIALQVAPDAPTALTRAAEAEYRDGEYDDAEWLAAKALERAPFNVAALRILGLVKSQRGETDQANEILTLAGNWSLRDSETHAWLVERRLRQGDYGSAFAHADTLARRRVEMWPAIFSLFQTAALEDPRARVALIAYLRPTAPWRNQFIQSLNERQKTRALSIMLAVMMKDHPNRYRSEELATLYSALLASDEYPGIVYLRRAMSAADAPLLADGNLAGVAAQGPIGWTFGGGPGLTVEAVEAPGGRRGLHVMSDGYRDLPAASQMVALRAGRYKMTGRSNLVSGRSDRLHWVISCAGGGRTLADSRDFSGTPNQWGAFSFEFQVPDSGCAAQWVRLMTNSGTGADPVDIWIDALAISPGADSASLDR